MTGALPTATAALSLADLRAFDPNHKPRDGGETDCCCPLCGTGKPVDAAHRSLSYNAQTGAWNCHRCHAKGKLREFWTEAKAAPATSRRERDRQRIRRALQLPPSVPAVDNVDSAWKKRIGVLARLEGTPAAVYLESRGLPADFCHAAGARFASDFFGRPAVVFPLRGENDELTAAQGRYVDGRNDPRLPRMRTAGARRLGVFATPGAWESAALVLVEAPIDALSLALCGVPAVALCGCEGLPDWLKMRCAFQTVICAFDADAAGDKAAGELARDIARVRARALVLRLRPDGGAKDWNAALLSRGADDLRIWLAQELASVALTGAADAETTESPTEEEPGPCGQNWAVSEGIADALADPFDGTEPALPDDLHRYPPHAPRSTPACVYLLAEARRGNLPGHACVPSARSVKTLGGFAGDTNARVIALFAAFEQAHDANDADRAEHLAAELLDWAEWWHGIEQRIGPSVYRLDDPRAPRIPWLERDRDGMTYREAEAYRAGL